MNKDIISKELLDKFDSKDFLSIAKIIDNDFNGSEKTFSAIFLGEYYFLSTNKCDGASLIRLYISGKVERLGEDTNGYIPIQKETLKRVNEWILENKDEDE